MSDGAILLKLLRDGVFDDWVSLCREFGLDPKLSPRDTLEYQLLGQLDDLRRSGLVDFEWDPMSLGRKEGKITLSEKWPRIQEALGISLTNLAELGPNSLVVEPFRGLMIKMLMEHVFANDRDFSQPKEVADGSDVFVVMPFSDDLQPVYEVPIRTAARNLGVTVARADDIFNARSVMSNIWSAIVAARVLVADCTGRNPNVFYEIGLAHAVGKPVILIAQKNDDVPSDLKHMRYIQYDSTKQGMLLLQKRLSNALKAELMPGDYSSLPARRYALHYSEIGRS